MGAERLRAKDSAVDAFAREDLSTVDDLDTEAGRLALVLLLAGASPGSYGVKKTADDGVLPRDPRRRAGGLSCRPILVAARDEEERIADTVAALRARVSRTPT